MLCNELSAITITKMKEREGTMKKVIEAWKKWKRENLIDDFSNHWGPDCFGCKKGDCNPAYCRSIGLKVDK